MNWEAIGAVGEILGALAVLETLIYMAAQLRHTRQEARRTNAAHLSNEGHGLFKDHIENERLARVRLKYTLALGGELPPFARELVEQHGATSEDAMLLWNASMLHWLRNQRVIENIGDLSERDRKPYDDILRGVYAGDPLSRRFYQAHKHWLPQHVVA